MRTTAEGKFVNAREELSFGAPNFDIEDYSFVNVAAEYEINPHLSLFGRINNLTNEKYAEVFGFPALGRGAYGGLRVSFRPIESCAARPAAQDNARYRLK